MVIKRLASTSDLVSDRVVSHEFEVVRLFSLEPLGLVTTCFMWHKPHPLLQLITMATLFHVCTYHRLPDIASSDCLFATTLAFSTST